MGRFYEIEEGSAVTSGTRVLWPTLMALSLEFGGGNSESV
jgi:hypothetical protein